MATLINTARLKDVDQQAWLADVFDRIADIRRKRPVTAALRGFA